MSWIVWVIALVAAAVVGRWLLRSRRQARSLAAHLTDGEDALEKGRDHREAESWLESHGRDDGADWSAGSDGADGDGD